MENNFQSTERIGLYIMVIIILINTCDTNDRIKRIERKENIKQEEILKEGELIWEKIRK